MFEEFDLAEALLGFFQSFVRSAEIFSFRGKHLVAGFGFADHGGAPSFLGSENK